MLAIGSLTVQGSTLEPGTQQLLFNYEMLQENGLKFVQVVLLFLGLPERPFCSLTEFSW